MQALGLFSRSAILGLFNNSTVVLEKIADENSLNRTGTVNFNKYGQQDGTGFSPCSDKFVDNFLFYVYVSDYFVATKKTYTEVGQCNKHIRDMLTSECRKDGAAKSKRKQQWEKVAREVGNDTQENRKPFEDAIAEKQNKLQLLDNYSGAFSNNKIMQLKDLPLGSYNVMAMRETQFQFGEKYIMLVATDLNGTLGEYLTDEQKEKIREPKRNYLTLFEKPLAVLNITGWGRTPQRNVIVYCNLTLATEMDKDSIKSLRE